MDIYQLTNTTPYQMMCYVINTNNGKVIVIDGGNHGQAEELYRVLNKAGKTVDLWILTHFHSDHFGAIIDLLDKHDDIKIKRFIRNNQTDAVTASLAGEDVADYDEWAEYEKRAALPFEEIKRGDVITIDNVKLECLSDGNDDILVNNPNNQSIVFRISDGSFSMIFLGDLGAEGGTKLVNEYGNKLKADAVQMAHHGQSGVKRDVYERINPKYAFWPTPRWLWDNTPYLGGEKGKGTFQTPEVIKWIDSLKCINITSFEKTIVFKTGEKKLYENV